jgi:hypothetical protein
MPSVGQLIGGELAWRQHNGGHSVVENWPAFIEWASQFINAPRVRADAPIVREQRFTSNKMFDGAGHTRSHSCCGP